MKCGQCERLIDEPRLVLLPERRGVTRLSERLTLIVWRCTCHWMLYERPSDSDHAQALLSRSRREKSARGGGGASGHGGWKSNSIVLRGSRPRR